MSFVNLNLPIFLLGLIGLAGVLLLLQRLRVKYRDLPVVTTLFWKQAVEETRARVFMRRFRHPWAYLLALAIAFLVWIAFAEPKWNQDDDGDYVLLLDASAGMAWGNQFASTSALLREEAEQLPADRRRVYLCGSDMRLMLDRGEEGFLLAPRLKGVKPEASPSALGRQIRAFADASAGKGLNILLFGDAPVSQSVLDALPVNVDVKRLHPKGMASLRGNVGIAGLGISPSASGSYDRVDAMIRLVGDKGDSSLAVSLGDVSLNQALAEEDGAYYLRGLPARGDVLEVSIDGIDQLTIDNSARIVLPELSTIPVSIATDLPDVRSVVDVHPAFEVASGGSARVTVGTTADANLPSLVIGQGSEILVTYERTLTQVEVEELAARFATAGLERVGRKLQTDGNKSFRLAAKMRPGNRRKIEVGIDLLGSDYDFAQSSAFPIFMSKSIRWLAGDNVHRPFAIAGEKLSFARDLTVGGASYSPPTAGSYETTNGDPLEVSLGALSDSKDDAVATLASASEGGRWPGLVSWCLILALALLLVDWWFFQKGEIP